MPVVQCASIVIIVVDTYWKKEDKCVKSKHTILVPNWRFVIYRKYRDINVCIVFIFPNNLAVMICNLAYPYIPRKSSTAS